MYALIIYSIELDLNTKIIILISAHNPINYSVSNDNSNLIFNLVLASIITLFSLLSFPDSKSDLHNISLTKLNQNLRISTPPTMSTTAHSPKSENPYATTRSTKAHSIDSIINSHFQNYTNLDPIVYIGISQLILRYVSTYIYDSFSFLFLFFLLGICIYSCECNFSCFCMWNNFVSN